MMKHLFCLIALLALASCDFILVKPNTLGYIEANETKGPCGGVEDTAFLGEATNHPIAGLAFAMWTGQVESLWRFKAALVSDLDNWVELQRPVAQLGYGHWCLPSVPGVEEWVGQEAIVQVKQFFNDVNKYQV
jgi:hypothetical protein